jgi:hypothetical protein
VPRRSTAAFSVSKKILEILFVRVYPYSAIDAQTADEEKELPVEFWIRSPRFQFRLVRIAAWFVMLPAIRLRAADVNRTPEFRRSPWHASVPESHISIKTPPI